MDPVFGKSLGEEEYHLLIEVDHGVPVFHGDVRSIASLDDPGVVYEDINTSVSLLSLLHDMWDDIEVGEVCNDLCESAADSVDLPCSLLTTASCDADHVCAGAGVGCADPLP